MMQGIGDLLQYRELVLTLARRDIKARYKQSAVGIAWALIQPLAMMVIFSVVFVGFAGVPSDGLPYPLFAYSALIFWTFFATVFSQGTVAIAANAALVRKIYFPRETLLLALLLSAGLDLGIAGAILGGMLIYYGAPVTLHSLWVMPILGLQVVFSFGLICGTSALQVYVRDVRHALPLIIQLWVLATPVAYPVSVVPERLKWVYLLNPMAPIIDGYRSVILRGQAPNLRYLFIGGLASVAVLCVGYTVFKRAERTFGDVI